MIFRFADYTLPTLSSTRIEDFGEKLGGARKDKTALDLMDYSDSELAALPLSQIWPKSDIDKIKDDFIAALATVIRSTIPRKPKKCYSFSPWVGEIKRYADLMRQAMEQLEQGTLTKEDVVERLSKHFYLEESIPKLKLLSHIDRRGWRRIGWVREYPDDYKYDFSASGSQIKIPAPYVALFIDGRYRQIQEVKSVAEALNQIKNLLSKPPVGRSPSKSNLSFEVRRIRGRNDYYFINKKGDREYRRLKEFTDVEEAWKYVHTNQADLVAAWDAVKARDNVGKTDVRNSNNRARVGKDWRHGENVTTELFHQTFGFRGVEFGNWVRQGKNAKQRQGLLNQAYDALMDLADIINAPPKALSLNGELGLGFGSRGRGRASAHFEPDNLVINLTRTRGAGTLAHEWFHAMDNYFQRQRSGGRLRADNYITYQPEFYYEGRTGNWSAENDAKVRPVVARAFGDLVRVLNASPMKMRSQSLDNGSRDGYWSKIIERAARAFENYVIAKMASHGYSNDYLANVKAWEQWGGKNPERYPYLKDDEMVPIAAAFDTLFTTIE